MTKAFQWVLVFISLAVAGAILVFGLAGIAVVLGFLMLPTGVMFIVRGAQNLANKSKTVYAMSSIEPRQITLHPVMEIGIGALLLFVGVSLAESFIGIVLIGIAIYLLVYFLDKAFRRAR